MDMQNASRALIEQRETQAPTETLPTFKRRWWHWRWTLDHRPVVWSLRNRPQEWKVSDGRHRLQHIPSQHDFWIANGKPHLRLWDANCSCVRASREGGGFTRYQRRQIWRAFKAWQWELAAPARLRARRETGERREQLQSQWAGHFITPPKA